MSLRKLKLNFYNLEFFQATDLSTSQRMTFLRDSTFQSTNTNQNRVHERADDLDDDALRDAEADRLFEWTQELSFEDLMTTPRVGTANGL